MRDDGRPDWTAANYHAVRDLLTLGRTLPAAGPWAPLAWVYAPRRRAAFLAALRARAKEHTP